MPTVEITAPVQYWPLRTRTEMDTAAWEILDDVAGFTAHTMRGYDNTTGGQAAPFLQIMQAGVGEVAAPPLGSVLLHAGGWEVLTVEQAVTRGLPLEEISEGTSAP